MELNKRIAALPIPAQEFYDRVAIICQQANVTFNRAEQYLLNELCYDSTSALLPPQIRSSAHLDDKRL
jgi:hypothetical protein